MCTSLLRIFSSRVSGHQSRHGLLVILAICFSLTLFACDPEDVINDYFKKSGLTRLAVLRTDVQPGTIILMRGKEAFLGDHILDYVDQEANPKNNYGTFGGSAQSEVTAVLRKFQGNTQLSGKMAMKFLASVFHLGPSLDLKLTGKVTIAMPDAKVRKMKIASLEKFLTRKDSGFFQTKVRHWVNKGLTPYVAYEVYRAKSLKVVAEQGKDVAPSVKADTVVKLPVQGEVDVNYKKVTSNELSVAGNRYFAFAVRTARLELVGQEQSIEVDRTDFVKPKEWGIKSAGTDDQYASPLVKGFDPVMLQTGLPYDF